MKKIVLSFLIAVGFVWVDEAMTRDEVETMAQPLIGLLNQKTDRERSVAILQHQVQHGHDEEWVQRMHSWANEQKNQYPQMLYPLLMEIPDVDKPSVISCVGKCFAVEEAYKQWVFGFKMNEMISDIAAIPLDQRKECVEAVINVFRVKQSTFYTRTSSPREFGNLLAIAKSKAIHGEVKCDNQDCCMCRGEY